MVQQCESGSAGAESKCETGRERKGKFYINTYILIAHQDFRCVSEMSVSPARPLDSLKSEISRAHDSSETLPVKMILGHTFSKCFGYLIQKSGNPVL